MEAHGQDADHDKAVIGLLAQATRIAAASLRDESFRAELLGLADDLGALADGGAARVHLVG